MTLRSDADRLTAPLREEQHGAARAPHLRVHAVTVPVADQDRSRDFFVECLGFHVVSDVKLPDSEERWVAVAPPDGTAVLSLIATPPEARIRQPASGPPTTIFVTDNLQAQFEMWEERGVRFHHRPVASIWGAYTLFEEPDANAFMLVSVDPVTREFEAHQRARADREEAERRSTHEHSVAMQVQARLFPQQRPESATLDYAGLCVQARQVGGDYYDFLDLGDDRLGLLVGDISGKGIGAALLMANLQANVRSHSAGAPDRLVELLRSVNGLFYANTPDNAYATLFFAVYDGRCQSPALRELRASAGAAAPCRRRLGTAGRDGGRLGLFEPWDCTMAECQLHEGDTLAIYSDGVTEAQSETGEEFGDGRLSAGARRDARSFGAGGARRGLAEVQKFSGSNQLRRHHADRLHGDSFRLARSWNVGRIRLSRSSLHRVTLLSAVTNSFRRSRPLMPVL